MEIQISKQGSNQDGSQNTHQMDFKIDGYNVCSRTDIPTILVQKPRFSRMTEHGSIWLDKTGHCKRVLGGLLVCL